MTGVVLHADGTVSHRCVGCGEGFEVGPKTTVTQRWCSPKCRKRYRRVTDAAKISRPMTTLHVRDFSEPLKEAYEGCCLTCSRTAGLYWYTAVEVRRHALVGLAPCTRCGGLMSLQAAYGRSRAASV